MTRHILLSAALAAALAAPAAAQDQAEFVPTRTPGWSFTPTLTVAGSFDSNVALASSLDASHRRQSDGVFLVGPAGQLEFASARTEFGAGYRGSLRRYVDIDQLNGFDQYAYFSLRRLATRRVTFYANDSYALVPTTDEITLNGLPFVRTGSRTNSLQSGIEARLTRTTDLAVRYELQWVDFDREETLLMGGFVHGVRSELKRRLGSRIAVGGEYNIRLADLAEGRRQLTFQDAGGAVHYQLAPHTAASFALGFSHLNDRTFHVTRLGPYVRAGLTHKTDKATLGAEFERTFLPSFGFGGSSTSQQLRGFVTMPLAVNRMYVQGSAAWRRSEPLVSAELPLDTSWLRGTLGYQVARWLRTEGFYTFTRQDSRVAGGLVNRHRAGVQLVVSQPMRIQ